MTAEAIAKALDGREVGTGWMACCPAHDDREPSLSIHESEDKVLVRCHAGCDQQDVIVALKARKLWDGGSRPYLRRAIRTRTTMAKPDRRHDERTAVALSIWQSTLPPDGTPVEMYLAGRGLSLPLAPSLRFHHALKHPSGRFWPCMVALVYRHRRG